MIQHRYKHIFLRCRHLDIDSTMRTLSLNILFLICVFAIASCSGPIGPIAGGELEGNPKTWPQTWAFADDCENVLLQTNSADPYSVTLWGVSIDQAFYVASGDQSAAWVNNLDQDPAIVLGIEDNLYTGAAERVSDPQELLEVVEQYSLKYDFYVDENNEADGVIFRLTAALK